ncbi:MAG: hypothetical protein RLO50_10355 [Azospirillaceae bacterium]
MTSLIRRAAILASTSTLAVLASAPASFAQTEGSDLELRRVLLSTGGVGYFEYATPVDGNVSLTLDVRLDQVDDVLKSIVVFDDLGTLGEISLPGQQPLREVFRDMPFAPEDLQSPAALLNALRGVEIATSGPRAISGRIISVNQEVRDLGDGRSETVHRVSLMTEDGIRQLILEETDSVDFVSADLNEQIGTALAALASNNEQDRREFTIRLNGEGVREARVAYVVEVPLWKTAYRLTITEDGSPGNLQGWAILENLSGEDWDGIELTVASGNPVTFSQALYDAYFVDRPEIPVEVLGRVLPPVDEGGITLVDDGIRPREEFAEAERMPGAIAGLATGGFAAPMPSAPPPPPRDQAQLVAAESDEATAQVLFQFPNPVTVESGHSALLPIVSRSESFATPLLYQPNTHATHPLATVRLSNDGESGLPPGILTIYQRDAETGLISYLGDARMDALPVGDDRLLPFAVEQSVAIDRQELSRNDVLRVAITGGVLRQTILDRRITRYTIEGDARRDHEVILQQTRLGGGFELVGEEDVELAGGDFRVTVAVPAGETVQHDVVQERTTLDQVDINTLPRDRIRFFASASALPDEVVAAFADLVERLDAVEALEQDVRQTQQEIDRIVADQDRIRRNLSTVPSDSDLFQRYMADLQAQEDRLVELRGDIEAQRAAAQQARQDLTEHVRDLNVGG